MDLGLVACLLRYNSHTMEGVTSHAADRYSVF